MKTRWMMLAAMLPLGMTGGCWRAEKALVVEKAWVRLPAVPGRPAAGYATILGKTGKVATMLRGATSPKAQRIELHLSMTMKDRMMSMKPVSEIPVPPDSRLQLAPGGAHMMIFGIAPELKPGDTMPIVFRFDGSEQRVDAQLVGAGDPAP